MRKINKSVVGLDIGSAKTAVCLGELDEFGRVEISGATMVKTRGIERGVVTDLGQTAECIEEAIKKVETKVQAHKRSKSSKLKKSIKIHSVYATISGEHILGSNTKSVLNLSNRPIEIGRKDTQRTIDSARYLATSIDREILHALAQEFIVDGYKRIKDPLGIYGTRLGVNLHIISAGLSFVTNVVKAVNRAGFDVDGIVYSGLATSLITLTEQDKQAGVILLELGAGTVNVLFFSDGSLQYTSVIPIGGYDITREIVHKLGIDFYQAEELKMQYKSRYSDSNEKSEFCNEKIIVKKDSSNYESIMLKDLVAIIDKKLNEVCKLIKRDLELSGILPRAHCGVVISGGMSFMDGIIEKLEKVIKLPVTLGIMRGFVSEFSGLSNIFYATSIGLVKYILNEQMQEYKHTPIPSGLFGKMVAKVKTMYDEYF